MLSWLLTRQRLDRLDCKLPVSLTSLNPENLDCMLPQNPLRSSPENRDCKHPLSAAPQPEECTLSLLHAFVQGPD
jgi:hypothetical protein